MINHEDNPDYLNSFLDYSITILNKSPNSIKEYNYDLATFLKFIKIRFGLTKEADFSKITIKDIPLDVIKQIKLDDIHAFLSYLTIVNLQPVQEKHLVSVFFLTILLQKPI